MRGKLSISDVKTRSDFESLNFEDKSRFKSFLKGTIVKQKDIQNYPTNYDWTLEVGEEGYLAPIIESYEDLSIVERFGFTKEQL